jgi:hypothetical protein
MNQPKNLQELCQTAQKWVASPKGQKVIQESLANAQELTNKLNKRIDNRDCDWQRTPYRKAIT